MAKLKPCPFCGSNDVGIQHYIPRRGNCVLSYVLCYDCEAAGPEKPAGEKATEAWNRRADNGRERTAD